jgi:hypothetical protein
LIAALRPKCDVVRILQHGSKAKPVTIDRSRFIDILGVAADFRHGRGADGPPACSETKQETQGSAPRSRQRALKFIECPVCAPGKTGHRHKNKLLWLALRAVGQIV